MVGLLVLALVPFGLISDPAPNWEAVGFGGGGLYWSVAFDPTQDGTLYMGGDVLGVYKSINRGKSWRPANRGIPGYEVLTLVPDPAAPGRLYAVTAQGIARSDDRAGSWTALPNPDRLGSEKFKSIRCLAVDPSNPRRLAFAAPDGRVLVSANAGQTWAQRAKAKTSASAVAFTPKGGVLLAATSEGILRIPPSGEAKTVRGGNARSVAIAPNGRRVWAAVGEAGIARSDDAGLSWTLAGPKTEKGDDWCDVVVDPRDGKVAHAVCAPGWGGRTATTRDGGKTWTVATTLRADPVGNPTDQEAAKAGPMAVSMPRSLSLNPQRPDELYYAGNWRSGYSADGGKTWEERTAGADITVFTDLRFHAGKAYLTAMDSGLYVRDEAAGWRQIFPRRWAKENSGHGWRVQVWDDGKQILLSGSPWDYLKNLTWRTLNGGDEMIRVEAGLPERIPATDTMWSRGYPRALASHPSNPYTVYLGIDGEPDGGIFKSTDGGWHWARLANQPPSKRMFYGLIVDPQDPKRLFWGTCGERGGIFRSEDGGESWRQVFRGDTWIFNLHAVGDGTLMAGGGRLWMSRDRGITWSASGPEGPGNVVGLESDPANPRRLWFSRVVWDTAASGGVFESTDAGATWREITGDLPNRKPLVLRYDPTRKELWAVGPGAFRLKRP